MSKKGKPIEVLIIEDQKEYVDTLTMLASTRRIKLNHCYSLEEGKEYMVSNKGHLISAVILDVVCLKTADQTVPDPTFISKAIQYFDKEHPKLPKAILSGETTTYAGLETFYKGQYEMFQKGPGEDNLLEFILEESKKSPLFKFANMYPELYEIFEKEYLESHVLNKIIKSVNNMNNGDPSAISDNLGRLRVVLEEIYKKLNQVRPDIVSNSTIERGEVKVNATMKSLYERGIVEQQGIINQFSWPIYQISSNFGSHSKPTSKDYYPTKYTVQALVFALFDLLLWFKTFIED
ncbi:MAG: hypothetical protein V2B20_10155 [Pseudomonadota bacterium]